MVGKFSNKNNLVKLVLLMGLGCATAETVTPRYYKPMLKNWEGTLWGDQVAHDLDAFKTCAPTTKNAAPCVIMKAEDFFEFKKACSDYKQASGLQEPEIDTQ
jgi:hypothetical protein